MGDTSNTENGSKSIRSEDEKKKVLTVAGSSHEKSTPKIFKLTIDCFDEIFEYLSLKDQHSVGQTCKTMQQVAGEYFKQNYSAAQNIWKNDSMCTLNSSNRFIDNDYYIYTNNFIEFMSCISIADGKLETLQYFQSHIDEFKSINSIHVRSMEVNQEKMEFIRKILPKIETIQIGNFSTCIPQNFYELVLKNCINLKRIRLTYRVNNFNNILVRSHHEWMLKKYSKMEHIELIPLGEIIIDELNEFFQLNPKVQRFTTTTSFLWTNKDGLLKSNAKLDVLDIKEGPFCMNDMDNNTATIRTIWDLLIQLHKQGFYRRLFIYISSIDQDCSIKLNSVPGLELLCTQHFNKIYNMPFFSNLKELSILNGLNYNNAELLANGLVNLERLYVNEIKIVVIMPFIQQSRELKKIKMLLKTPNYYLARNSKANGLNLVALNREREKLSRARKLTIYVQNDVFLATKWDTKNGDINLSHIEMKRIDSFEWKQFI